MPVPALGWGYVFKGKLVYHTTEGDIEITDGEAYYGPRESRPPPRWPLLRIGARQTLTP